jgi:hypothetical protein
MIAIFFPEIPGQAALVISLKHQSWFKVLNPDYSQARGREEMFEKFRERGEQAFS